MTQPITVTLAGGDLSAIRAPLVCLALPSNGSTGVTLPAALRGLDEALEGALHVALEARDFRGSRDETLMLSGPAQGPRRVLLVGLGAPATTPVAATNAVRRAAAVSARAAGRLGTGSFAFFADGLTAEQIEAVVVGMQAGAWQYLDTKTLPPEHERKAPVASAQIVADASPATTKAVEAGLAIAAGQVLARTLAMMPGNLCTPEFLATTGQEIAARHHMRATVLDRAGLTKEGMGAFLAVAQGTPVEPYLIALEYMGAPKMETPPIALVGKGLCFDSGGISIKPAANMEQMKFDMCGAAGVLGAMETIARLKLPVNVVGLIGATVNMPSGTAMNPGDVVRSQLGKYIEIVNTDAEGRLVLADLLSYVRRFKPSVVVDAATLTGACVIALGHTTIGVMGTDQRAIDDILHAGERAGERGWPLPIYDDYFELIKSDVADMKNSGGRAAGTITAAMFLKEFADGYPWVHLDIAGTAYTESDSAALARGPSGIPVGLFVEFVRARATK